MSAPMPAVGASYTDARGRTFDVFDVDIGDSLGRDVGGRVSDPLHPFSRPYTTSYAQWLRTWHKKTPPTPTERMRAA